MPPALRNLFPYLAIASLGLAVVWAVSFGTLPQADFTFANGDQIKTVDPAQATGQPENRVINCLFEGLLRSLPQEVPGGPDKNLKVNVPLQLFPGVAELPQISEDAKTYTFKIRDGARWSNGRQITAHDFTFSWQRLLHPETVSEYAYQLHYVVGAEAYNRAKLAEGDAVEVELYDRPDPGQQYPRGTMLRGKLIKITSPPPLEIPPKTSKQEEERLTAEWERLPVYTVEVATRETSQGEKSEDRRTLHFSKDPEGSAKHFPSQEIQRCHHVLVDFESVVGIEATDEMTLRVELKSPTPYFGELVAFYPLYPVCRECIEEHGTPNWTQPEHIVSNGPFRMQSHRIGDRVRMVKSDTYWNKDRVQLSSVDALAVKSDTTALNMYMTGQVDWISTVPNTVIPDLRTRDDFHSTPMLTTYIYRLNVDRPPLNDVRVRRALNAAINKEEICERIMKAGQIPARSFVPPGMAGYESSLCGGFDLEEARRLLEEAGYPNGKGLPAIEIVYNTNEDHATIAQVVQQQWGRLGIKCELRNLEWGAYLDTLSNTKYMAARSGWIGDYPDPNTFLDMFLTDGPNNQTNWSNAEYDRLIDEAKRAGPAERLKLMTQAERILMDELPLIPMFFYVSKNMVNPRVKGFTSNIQDLHPIELLSIDKPQP